MRSTLCGGRKAKGKRNERMKTRLYISKSATAFAASIWASYLANWIVILVELLILHVLRMA